MNALVSLKSSMTSLSTAFLVFEVDVDCANELNLEVRDGVGCRCGTNIL